MVLDPHDGASIGLPEPSPSADLVVVTHDHEAHSALEAVEGSEKVPVVVEEVGDLAVRGVEMRGVETFHDASRGEERGENTVVRFLMDGVYLCHLGDLGHPLSDEEVEEIGEVDVLFVPVGGGCTIGPEEAWAAVEALEPSLVFPMHYAQPGLTKEMGGLEPFLELADVTVERPGRSYEFATAPSGLRIVVLDPPPRQD